MNEFLGILCVLGAFFAYVREQPRLREKFKDPERFLKDIFRGSREKVMTLISDARLHRTGRELEAAGISKQESKDFLVKRVFLSVAGFLSGVVLLAFHCPLYLIPACTALGWIYPSYRVKRRIQLRRREIVLALPYYLDLLTLALEAGLDLIAAIEELIRRDSANPLQEELFLTLKSIRMGETRSAAFRRLAVRTGVEPLSLLAGAIAQSEELGASLGGLLRLQAENVRREIFRQAEERALRAPIKMLLPLIGLIFPVVFILLFSPIALRFLN